MSNSFMTIEGDRSGLDMLSKIEKLENKRKAVRSKMLELHKNWNSMSLDDCQKTLKEMSKDMDILIEMRQGLKER